MDSFKTVRTIKYILEQLGTTGTTQLLKLVYLADLNARSLLGRPISGLNYHYGKHGPFDKRFYQAVEELEERGCIARKTRWWPGKEKKEIADTGVDNEGLARFSDRLSPGEKHVLDYVLQRFGRMDLPDLLAHVYDTKPMKAASKGHPLHMEVVDGEARDEIGFDIEEVLAAKRRAEEGKTRKASEFFASLRSGNRG